MGMKHEPYRINTVIRNLKELKADNRYLHMFKECFFELSEESQRELADLLLCITERLQRKNHHQKWGTGTVAELLTVLVVNGYL